MLIINRRQQVFSSYRDISPLPGPTSAGYSYTLGKYLDTTKSLKRVKASDYTQRQLTQPHVGKRKYLLETIYLALVKTEHLRVELSQEAFAERTGCTLRYVQKSIPLFIARGELECYTQPRKRRDKSAQLIYTVPALSTIWRKLQALKASYGPVGAISHQVFVQLMLNIFLCEKYLLEEYSSTDRVSTKGTRARGFYPRRRVVSKSYEEQLRLAGLTTTPRHKLTNQTPSRWHVPNVTSQQPSPQRKEIEPEPQKREIPALHPPLYPRKATHSVARHPNDARQPGWHNATPQRVEVAPAAADSRRATLINNPDLDDQMAKLERLMGKEYAEKYLARVLDNQQYTLQGDYRWEYLKGESANDYEQAQRYSERKSSGFKKVGSFYERENDE